LAEFPYPHSMTEHILISSNTRGRDFVVGDIHGHIDLFWDALSYEGFDPKQDRVFSVGDLIDRGPDSLACLKLLDKRWFYAVRGNHEQMMIDWAYGDGFDSWKHNFGGWTESMTAAQIATWVERLGNLPISMTVEGDDFSVGICHAEPSGFNWDKMISDSNCFQQMMWGRKLLRGEVDTRPVKGVDITVHGHTPVPNVRRIGNRHFIDTGAGIGDYLTVRNMENLFREYRDYAALL